MILLAWIVNTIFVFWLSIALLGAIFTVLGSVIASLVEAVRESVAGIKALFLRQKRPNGMWHLVWRDVYSNTKSDWEVQGLNSKAFPEDYTLIGSSQAIKALESARKSPPHVFGRKSGIKQEYQLRYCGEISRPTMTPWEKFDLVFPFAILAFFFLLEYIR